MNNNNKVSLITPLLMLSAGATASIIMYIRGADLYTMLWGLLIVLLVFYVIGDIVKYIYTSIKPRIIPKIDYDDIEVPVRISYENGTGNVIEHENVDEEEYEDDEFEEKKSDYDFDAINTSSDNDEYSSDELDEYSDEDLEEYQDE